MLARNRNSEQKKTVIRSIRIQKDLSEALEKLAVSRGLTPNALVASILTKHVEWDNQSERYGFAMMPLELFRELLYTDSTKEIEQVARALGPSMTKDILQFWFKRVSVNSFIEYVGLISKYSGMAQCDVEHDGREMVLTYRHQLGERWSRFISAYFLESLKKVLDIEARADVSNSQIVLRWASP